MIEAQIVETCVLSIINYQSLIATKASRIVSAASGRPVIEFGSRRAHGPQAGFLASRASFIGGCIGTSNIHAGLKLGIPVFGTMAHSFIMSFENEVEAFQQFNHLIPSGFLLVDTYDSIRAIKKIIQAKIHPTGIRLDSGDLFQLSMDVRKILDRAGYSSTKIMASGDLNEYLIKDLINRGAPIDLFAVGTELVTSIHTLQEFHLQQLNTLPSKLKDLYRVPETFPVKFSKKLVTLLNEIIQKNA
jgi:nicotinate phosphoribosyltransferase